MILCGKAVVKNFAGLTRLMCAGINERGIFQMLVYMTGYGIQSEYRRVQRRPALARESAVGKIFSQYVSVVVVDRVRPERRIVNILCA